MATRPGMRLELNLNKPIVDRELLLPSHQTPDLYFLSPHPALASISLRGKPISQDGSWKLGWVTRVTINDDGNSRDENYKRRGSVGVSRPIMRVDYSTPVIKRTAIYR